MEFMYKYEPETGVYYECLVDRWSGREYEREPVTELYIRYIFGGDNNPNTETIIDFIRRQR